MIKAVIFDHDGVIADTEPLHYRAGKNVISKLGIEIEAWQKSRHIGRSTRESWELMKKTFKIEESVDALIAKKTAAVISIIKQEGVIPNPGLIGLLESLTKGKFRMAIASGQIREVIDAVLSKIQISDYFESIVSGEDTKEGKPHPEVFLTAASQLGIKPHECVVIEDSGPGVEAAKAAGMKCIALRMPSTMRQDISKADYIVNSLADINLSVMIENNKNH
jgi:beta-phosphoglucomutase family hydrolase